MKKQKYDYYIGIDPGVNTGVAIWDRELKLLVINVYKIHDAMGYMRNVKCMLTPPYLIRVEDARQRKWFGSNSNAKLQGAGSIKRDCQIWEDFLTALGIPFEMVAPKNNRTKMSAAAFKNLTGYKGKTNEHGRDAGALVFGM